ncbi:MAG: acyl-CoA dehydrogenase [Elusimicrobia bacterium RIFOXYB2_FULL_62_6]|nr:MAG: acyl-CoA dehydrogenase [Elusimicrobia bacterium RIFOXYB2_FULL_62_6]
MDFAMTPDNESVRKMVREFAEKKLAPTIAERDEKELFDRGIFDEMGKLGLMGIPFPENYGGSGMDYIAYAIAMEEISRVDPSTAIGMSVHTSLCAGSILQFGTEEQKQKYLVPLAQGVKLGAFGLTEPNAGTDVAAGATIAVKDGDSYFLNGTKVFNTNGGEAEVELIFAKTNKEAGLKGMSAFILEKGSPGLSFGKKEVKMGIRAAVQREVVMVDAKTPAANLLGKEGDGFKIAMTALDAGRIGIAAQATGIAQGALEEAIKYAKNRIQFGKPIATQQAVSFKLADMASKVEAARLLTLRAAFHKAKGLPFSKEAAMAKLVASDAAMSVTTDAVQVFGGYGYSREYPVERMMRDAKITQIYEGTSEVQRMVIAGSILR